MAQSLPKDDETVVFYPTLGRRPADVGPGWELDLHGRIFELERSSITRRLLLSSIREAVGGDEWTAEERKTFQERARHFLVDNERGKRLSIRLGEREHALEPSGPDGHFAGRVRLDDEEVRALAGDQGRVVPFRAVTRERDPRVFAGSVHLLEPEGVSVLSDIDDTIKESGVLDKKTLIANTFLRAFRPVEGMSGLYAGWAVRGASFHYLSASPWQLYEPLAAFLRDSGFPAGTIHLRRLRLADTSTVIDLLGSPEPYKTGQIESLFAAFSRRRFLLVGDSGEKDPEIYGAAARAHPGRAALILIRDVTGEDAASARMRRAFDGVPAETWRIFREPADVEPLARERVFGGR
jgi:hypothetical protein